MSKRLGLLFLILATVFVLTDSQANWAEYHYRSVYQDQPMEAEEPAYGTPFTIMQCIPSKVASGNFRIFLGEAIKNRSTGAVIDSEGNRIVPEGFRYSFHRTKDDADRAVNPIDNGIVFIQNFDENTSALTYWLRVESVVNTAWHHVSDFNVEVKSDNCGLNDRVTGRPDLYLCGNTAGEAVFSLSETKNQFYYGHPTQLYRFENGKRGAEILGDDILKFKAKDGQQVETVTSEGGETASRVITLHVETIPVVSGEVVLKAIQSKEVGNVRYATFDLTNAITSIFNPEVTHPEYYEVNYFTTTVPIKEIDDVTAFEAAHGTSVRAVVKNKLSMVKGTCNKSVTVRLEVEDKPYIPALPNVTWCDSSVASYSLVLTDQTSIIADGRTIVTQEEAEVDGFDPKDKFTIGYFNSKEDAENNVNAIVGAEINVALNEKRQMWTRLTSLETGNFNTAFFYVSLGYDNLRTGGVEGDVKSICRTDNTAGVSYVNLRSYDGGFIGKRVGDEFGPSLNPEGAKLSVAYYKSIDDAQIDKRMPEAEVTNFPIVMGKKTGPIYARVVMEDGFGCIAEGDENIKSFYISLSVRPIVDFTPAERNLQICTDFSTGALLPVILSLETNEDVTIRWYRAEKEDDIFGTEVSGTADKKTIEVTNGGKYWANVSFKTKPHPEAEACPSTNTWVVNDPLEVYVENTDATGMLNSLELNEQGEAPYVSIGVKGMSSGNLEYALDGGAFQSYNTFSMVPIGEHVAWVSSNGCLASTTFSVFGYPKYFTPNGDGRQDTWNIPGLKGHPEAKIFIFDRNGKLLKQISPMSEGWDGTFNGRPMPSTDYWFTVEFVNDFPGDERDAKTMNYKGHFSLKR